MTPFQSADQVKQRQRGATCGVPAAVVARALIGPDNEPVLMISADGYPEFKDPVTGNWVKFWPSQVDAQGDNAVNTQTDPNL